MKKNILLLLFCTAFGNAFSQTAPSETSVEMYGFVMTDIGYNMDQVNPSWYDVMRPSRLPSYKDEFGTNGNVYFSAKQTRFGIKSSTQTSMGELKTVFD